MKKVGIKTNMYREIIRKKGFTMNHIAEKMGIQQSYFSMKINGKRYLTKKELKKLDKILS